MMHFTCMFIFVTYMACQVSSVNVPPPEPGYGSGSGYPMLTEKRRTLPTPPPWYYFLTVNEYLQAAGMNTTIKYKTEWIELCSVYARIENAGWYSKVDIKTCTVTKNDGVLEISVRQNSQWNCGWSYRIGENIPANTNYELLYKIQSKYNKAIAAAIQVGDFSSAGLISAERAQHDLMIKTDKHMAFLSATATSKPRFGSGAKCDLTLMGKIRHLDV
jgi:hypothetical protein